MRKRILTFIVVAVLIGALVGLRHFRKLSRVGVGYAAEQTCACLFVSGRTIESCTRDLDPLAQRIVTIEHSDGEVRAHVPLLSSARARYEPGFGCALVD